MTQPVGIGEMRVYPDARPRLTPGRHTVTMNQAISKGGPEVLEEPVSDFMTKAVITARESDTVDQLMTEMTTRRFRHMPVVDRDRLSGLVSIGDLVKIQIAEIETEAAMTREYTGLGGLSNTERNLHNETIART